MKLKGNDDRKQIQTGSVKNAIEKFENTKKVKNKTENFRKNESVLMLYAEDIEDEVLGKFSWQDLVYAVAWRKLNKGMLQPIPETEKPMKKKRAKSH
jgi:hypothetical protein